jgi:ABC-type phosphate/phosphonate transport system substrate-binding protein
VRGGGHDGRAASVIPLDLLRGRRLAFNSEDSMSGLLALARDLEAEGESLAMFRKRIETGGHRASLRAVADGRADVAAIDCRSWALARCFEPAVQALTVVGWTGRRKGLPFITAEATRPEVVAMLTDVLAVR